MRQITGGINTAIVHPIFRLCCLLRSGSIPLRRGTCVVNTLNCFVLPFSLVPRNLLPIVNFASSMTIVKLILGVIGSDVAPRVETGTSTGIVRLLRASGV